MITSESANLWLAICGLGYVLMIVEWRWSVASDPSWQCNEPWLSGKCIACRCRLPIGHLKDIHICICGSRAIKPSSRICNCTEEGGRYCGDPECDIAFCDSCGDEFDDPCPRHEGWGET